ncbi:MAG: Na+/H+ antiporter [Acidobacteriota bacterium]
MNETHFAIEVFIILLLVASGVAMAAKWVRVPYTLMLVMVGIVLSFVHFDFLPQVHISPELILLIFLPALLFEAAWNLKVHHLRENLLPILLLATLGVGLSVAIIGLVLVKGLHLSWPTALLFGAMISATDPVSVLALLRKLNLPSRLMTIVEGESLLNDGTAVVVFRIILTIAAGSSIDSSGSLLLSSLKEFALVVFGGVAVGAIIGLVASTLTSYFDDHLLEITLTTIAAYGSFLLAEALHVSPVMAVLATGLIIGNYGRQVGMSPTTQVAVNSFWEYAAFVVNSLVFLLIGLEVQISDLLANNLSVSLAVLAMLAARLAAVYGLSWVTNRFAAPIPGPWQHILFWGGLRGSLSIALVLSLPKDLPDRSLLVTMIFGSIVFSLLVQGLTMSPLLRWLKLTRLDTQLKEYELLQSQLLAESSALAELHNLRAQGRLTERIYESIRKEVSAAHEALSERMAGLESTDRALEQQLRRRIHHHLTDVKKGRLRELMQEGMLSESTFRELSRQLDQREAVQPDTLPRE